MQWAMGSSVFERQEEEMYRNMHRQGKKAAREPLVGLWEGTVFAECWLESVLEL